MQPLADKALILIGFQNDYFSPDGILHKVIEESSRVTGVVENTVNLLRKAGSEFGLVVNTPIHFTEDYSELKKPIGILKVIADVGAFKEGSYGAEIINELTEFDDFVKVIPGKRGLNAFTNTQLAHSLHEAGIKELVIAGTVTSICIDSTARSAIDMGFQVSVLSDCTSSRTTFEQDFYCQEVFPLYAQVIRSQELIAPQ
jgi:nicotinamidase-related amidase